MANKIIIQTNSVDTNPEEIKRIYNELGNDAIEKIYPEIDELNAQIYNYSFLFLRKNYQIMRKVINARQIRDRIKQLRRNVKNTAKNPDKVDPEILEYFTFFKNYMQTISLTEEITKELYENIMWYQRKMNQILDQTVQMTFVFEDDATILFADSKDLLSSFDKSNIVFKYNINKYKGLTDQEKKEKNMIEYNANNLDYSALRSTYLEVIWRWRHATYRKTSGTLPGKLRVVLYKINNKWHGVFITAAGDISQAYAAYALNHIFAPFKNKDLEHQVEFFLFGEENGTNLYLNQQRISQNNIKKWSHGGVIGVDDEPGFLAGDVSLKNIEYGIKGIGSSSLNLRQIFDFAEDVVNKKGAFSKKDVQDWKKTAKDKTNTRNKLYNKVNQVLRNKIKDALNLDADLQRLKADINNRSKS